MFVSNTYYSKILLKIVIVLRKNIVRGPIVRISSKPLTDRVVELKGFVVQSSGAYINEHQKSSDYPVSGTLHGYQLEKNY
jgi:hypothetical protein